jgi:hypothetical protein
MSAETLILATGLATVAVTGGEVPFTLKGVREQLWLQMFSEYTRRYHEIVRELLVNLVTPTVPQFRTA